MYRYSLNPTEQKLLSDKISMCRRLYVPALELDGTINGVGFADLSCDQTEDARQELIDAGVVVILAALNCPTNDDAAVRKWFHNAHFLGVENVLMPAPLKNETMQDYVTRLEKPCAYAENYGMGSLLTHTKEGLLSTEAALTEAVKTVGNVRTIVDPKLQAAMGNSAYMHCFYASRLKNSIYLVRVNDGMKDGTEKLPGQGVSQLRELVSLMLARRFDGYFSVEPYSGYTMEEILTAFRKELKNM